MRYPGEFCSWTGKSRADGVPPGRSVQAEAKAGVMGYPAEICSKIGKMIGYARGGLFKDKQEHG